MLFGYSRITATLLFIMISSVSTPAQRTHINQDMVLSIDCGRLLAMLVQVATLMKLQDEDVAGAETPAAELTAAISQYNQLRRIACERALIEGPQCLENYAPRISTSAAGLRGNVDSAEAHIRPFWETICSKLDDPAHPICQVE